MMDLDTREKMINLLDSKIMLSAAEVTALLAVSPPTVYKLHESGQIKGIKIGERRLFDSASVKEFMGLGV